MSEKDVRRLLARIHQKTEWASEPIEVEFTIKPEDHEDGPEWEVTRASGRLPDLAWLSHSVEAIGFDEVLWPAIKKPLEPGNYSVTMRLHGKVYGGPDAEEYDEWAEVLELNWVTNPSPNITIKAKIQL